MRIELFDGMYTCHIITSDNPKVIGEWFADLAPMMEESGKNSAMPPWRLTVYPSGDYSSRVWGRNVMLGAKELEWILVGFQVMEQGKTPVVVDKTPEPWRG